MDKTAFIESLKREFITDVGTGFPDIDRQAGILRGHVFEIAGKGKKIFFFNIFYNNLLEKKNILFISNSYLKEELYATISSMGTGIDSRKILTGMLPDRKIKQVKDFLNNVKDFSYLRLPSIEEFVTAMRTVKPDIILIESTLSFPEAFNLFNILKIKRIIYNFSSIAFIIEGDMTDKFADKEIFVDRHEHEQYKIQIESFTTFYNLEGNLLKAPYLPEAEADMDIDSFNID